MTEVDLRELRYFVAVAEERSFTRAAARLWMTQPALSRAIRRMETVVGTPLLVRGYRDLTLTAAGQVLFEQARTIDKQTIAAIQLARRADARPTHSQLRISAQGCDVVVLDKLVSSHNLTGPPVRALAMALNHDELADHLRDGHAEVGLIREPFDDRGLDSEELLSEPRVVLLSATHPLASRPALKLAQLTDLPVLRWAGEHGEAVLAWPPDVARHDWVPGPQITDTAHLHAITLLGQGIGFVPESMARAESFAGVHAVRVIDAPPSTVRIAWAESNTSPLVAGFIRYATTAINIAAGRRPSAG
jgi:DNA-binding transcriptional LysR family regulator